MYAASNHAQQLWSLCFCWHILLQGMVYKKMKPNESETKQNRLLMETVEKESW